MPRYMVERTFPDGLSIPTNESGRETTAKVASKNAEVGVTWVHSYVTPDRKKTFCIYEGPNEAAIRQAAERNGLPVDLVTPVSVLDPYFYNV
jgi:predicted amidohydrolase YtcJ